MQHIYKYRYYILATFFVLTLILFWPGVPMQDSAAQYLQAQLAVYSDHHPPVMAFVWHYLDKLYPGSGLMFLLQVMLIYSGVAVLMKTSEYMHLPNPYLANLLLLILPIYPQVLIYEVVILKDVQFAASFLLSAAILAYYTIRNKQPKLTVVLLLLALFIYGAAVKYQAQILLIILAFWLGCLLIKARQLWRKLLVGIILYAIAISAVCYLNNILIQPQNKSYAWQYVKLYDLAAMSISLRQDLIPDFNKTSNFTFDSLQERFKYPAIDSLVFMSDPLLNITKNEHDMHELRHIWWQEIYDHPIAYLKHRLKNMQYMLLARPGYAHEAQDVPVTFVGDYPHTIGVLFFIFMSHLPVIILGIGYFVLALRSWHKTKAALVLFGFSSTALLMVVLLFFMSMAGTPRYTYVSIVLVHASHIFAYACLRHVSIKSNRLNVNKFVDPKFG